jgi:hypothetical protein
MLESVQQFFFDQSKGTRQLLLNYVLHEYSAATSGGEVGEGGMPRNVFFKQIWAK